jgi:DNA-binding LytR/AlgR family response regulator
VSQPRSKTTSTAAAGAEPRASSRPLAGIEVASRRGLETLPVDTIEWFEAERDYVRLHADRGEFLIRRSMRTLEAGLDPDQFLRTHRSAIVNRARIRRVEHLEGGRLQIRLASGKVAPVSAAYGAAVRALAAPR